MCIAYQSGRKGGTYTNLDDGLNFSNKALEHMGESGRQVPVQTLQDAIRYGEAMPDPSGSSATMYYTTMYKTGKCTIWKFCMMKLQIWYIILSMREKQWGIFQQYQNKKGAMILI